MSQENNNPVIIRTDYHKTITFVGKPSAETCKALRAAGYDFNRQFGVWFERNSQTTTMEESSFVNHLAQ